MIRVTAAVLRRDGRVLVARRPPGDPRQGLFEFPGGKVEPGESPEEALRREIREELGVEIRVGKRLGAFPYESPSLRIELLAYEAEAAAGSPVPVESEAVRWVRPAELPGLPLTEPDRPLAELLAAEERSSGKGPPS